MKKICPNCGEIVESKYCTSCGQDLTGPEIVKICPKCGTQTASKFCTGCGESLLETSDNSKGTPIIQAEPLTPESSMESLSASVLYQKVKKIGSDKVKDLERDAEIKRAKKERDEEIRRLEQEKELEVRRLEQEKELNARRIAQEREAERLRILKEKEADRLKQEAEEKAELEKKAKLLETKRVYEEAAAYLENAEKSTDSAIAANFFRKAQSMFTSIAGWEDADEKSLYAARKAKEHEIIVEEKRIREQEIIEKQKREQVDEKKQGTTKQDNDIQESEVLSKEDSVATAPKLGIDNEQASEKAKKSKKSLIAIIAIVVAIGIAGAIFALSDGGSEEATVQNSSESSDDNSGASNEEASVGNKIPIDDGIEIEWSTGKAKLTAYQFEKSSYDGDCVNLYIDYTNPSSDEQTMLNNLYIDVFQNGIELDEKSWMTLDEEDAGFKEIQKGASIETARGYILRDASDLTVRFYTDDIDGPKEEITLQIPEEAAKAIKGTPLSETEEGEVAVKNGVTIEGNSAKAIFTGYAVNKDENTITFFFDFTNKGNEPDDMANTVDMNPFQGGVELETTGLSSTPAESHFFTQVEKGKTIHCGYSYELKDMSDITLKLSIYTDQGEIEESQELKIK